MRPTRTQPVPMISVGWKKVTEEGLGEFWEAEVKLFDRLTGIVPNYCALPNVVVKERSRDRNRAVAFALESVAARIKAGATVSLVLPGAIENDV